MATTFTFPRNASPGNSQEESPNSLRALRTYLGHLEGIARHGRLAADPKETITAIRCFTEPSHVLWRLAERDRRLA